MPKDEARASKQASKQADERASERASARNQHAYDGKDARAAGVGCLGQDELRKATDAGHGKSVQNSHIEKTMSKHVQSAMKHKAQRRRAMARKAATPTTMTEEARANRSQSLQQISKSAKG